MWQNWRPVFKWETLCPVLFSDPVGLLIVMPRAQEASPKAVDAAIEQDGEYYPQTTTEFQPEAYGLIDGRVVCFDYGVATADIVDEKRQFYGQFVGATGDSGGQAMNDKRLELLLTYTTFHIGVYLSLTTAFMGASILGQLNHPLLRWAVACFLVAGACGGIVAANIGEDANVSATTFFASTHRLNLWGKKWFRLKVLTTIEHFAFWAGILPVAIAFLTGTSFRLPK